MEYIKIKPIQVGALKEKNVNAIYWTITLTKNIQEAIAKCNLVWANEDGGTIERDEYFEVVIPNNVLQSWGADDSVIDNHILTYSPLFELP